MIVSEICPEENVNLFIVSCLTGLHNIDCMYAETILNNVSSQL